MSPLWRRKHRSHWRGETLVRVRDTCEALVLYQAQALTNCPDVLSEAVEASNFLFQLIETSCIRSRTCSWCKSCAVKQPRAAARLVLPVSAVYITPWGTCWIIIAGQQMRDTMFCSKTLTFWRTTLSGSRWEMVLRPLCNTYEISLIFQLYLSVHVPCHEKGSMSRDANPTKCNFAIPSQTLTGRCKWCFLLRATRASAVGLTVYGWTC